MKILIALTLILTFASCGKKENAKVDFNLNLSQYALAADGGIALYGISNSGDSFVRVLKAESPTLSTEIAPEIWNFHVITWAGPNTFEGNTKCASKIGVNLKDKDAIVDLEINFQSCNNPGFGETTDPSPGANSGHFANTLKIIELYVSLGGGQSPITCPDDPVGASQCVYKDINSYRISIKNYDHFGGSLAEGDTTLEMCVSGLSAQSVLSLNFPIRGFEGLFTIGVIELYPVSTDCNTNHQSNDKKNIFFRLGSTFEIPGYHYFRY